MSKPSGMGLYQDRGPYHVFLFDGFFCDEDNGYVRLDGISCEELDVLLSIAERQENMDMVIRPYARDVSPEDEVR